MRIEHGYQPANRWLERPLDERWRHWLTGCVCGAVVVGVSLAAFVGPRQTVMRMRYEIAQLTKDVDRLERERRRLMLEREALTSPEALAREVAGLGLEVAPRERVAHLTADGRLLFAPLKPTPGPTGRTRAPGGGKESDRPAMPARTRGARGGEGAEVGAGGARTPHNEISERPAPPARARGARGGEGAGGRAGGDRTPRNQ
jgi:hypothetical protein